MDRAGLWNRISSGQRLFCMAGPCVIESRDLCFEIAQRCQEICQNLGIDYIFKASFDKANRTSIRSFRGPGLEAGLQTLSDIRHQLALPVVTDIHEISQIRPVAEVVEILQIPAFLCRQTDLLVAAGESGAIVNVKKGQFLAPWDMKPVVGKLEQAGARHILLTERGSTFGYNNLVADMRSIPVMSQMGYPVVFDATHSVQLPGGGGDKSAGNGEFAPVLARAAIAAGCHGVFVETHPDPSIAMSDGPNMIPLHQLPDVLETLTHIFKAVNRASGH
ncbi:MAG: 3-deoxy-8-phosphooctulonate synthase [Verrucomicrobia bacterium]|nr:3-deoxy-8-phosphooctulonate synthase [Verrucomicrobiota bacterium]